MSEEERRFLEEQLEWVKERDRLLCAIEYKLREMKLLAEYAKEVQHDREKVAEIQLEINRLLREINELQKQCEQFLH
ncbi:hypothetical protein [Bacillus sp. FJAT-45350]|uniref:hypothetical protein n=1 Tax=Bacillus sp. FJAT-45350 TaxID=2011014 RepID=UPI000BB89E80|nr:hypothetical protein [Bacillus sp. FJAT-45350]